MTSSNPSKVNITRIFTDPEDRQLPAMMYATGDDRSPREDSILLLERMLVDYLITLCLRAKRAAEYSGARTVSAEHFLFALRNHPAQLARAEYMLKKDKEIATHKASWKPNLQELAKTKGEEEEEEEEEEETNSINETTTNNQRKKTSTLKRTTTATETVEEGEEGQDGGISSALAFGFGNLGGMIGGVVGGEQDGEEDGLDEEIRDAMRMLPVLTNSGGINQLMRGDGPGDVTVVEEEDDEGVMYVDDEFEMNDSELEELGDGN